MKNICLLILTFISLSTLCQNKVKVHLTFTNNYCGGARPTPQILEKYNTPHDLSNTKIKLTGKKCYIVTTDSVGNIFRKIKPGHYKISIAGITNPKLLMNYNPACSQMKSLAFVEINIVKTENNYEVNLHFPCDPCSANDKP